MVANDMSVSKQILLFSLSDCFVVSFGIIAR